MSTNRSTVARVGVVAAVTILVVLTVVLAARLSAQAGGYAHAAARAPRAVVPEPKSLDLSTLRIPCWSCPEAQQWPLAFRTDLDLLAPLGTGPANAADWLVAFRKPDGPRYAEAVAAEARRVDRPPVGRVLPPDDPLLLEAEPWCDQALMRFYPDTLTLDGPDTKLPNLLIALTFARSWVDRGRQATSFDAAMADFRRVIRLGRLLRQEDTVIISDLVGLACIRIGAEAIYDRARCEGKLELALVAAVVAGEAPPQKLLTGARITSAELTPYLRPKGDGSYALDLPDQRLDTIIAMANSCPDRRFKGEAMWNLAVVAALGSEAQATKAREVLVTLSRSDDPVIGLGAKAFLDRPVMPADVEALLKTGLG